MTKMSDEEIMQQIKENAIKLNQLLELNLDNASLIKTGGARNHTSLKAELKSMDALDPEEVKRIESDFSFNYSQTTFDDREE